MNIIKRIAQILKPIEQPEPAERALMFDQVAQQLMEWTYEEPGRPYFMTFYLEQGALCGLFNDAGQLSRAAIDVDSDGQTLMVGAMQPVVHEFTPIARSGFYTVRQADGRTRFFMVAGTAIINRVGEIDSTKLYDDMIRRAEETGFYPKLDFYHLGEIDPLFEFGQFDYLAREGVVYVGSGLFDEGHPLTSATGLFVFMALLRQPPPEQQRKGAADQKAGHKVRSDDAHPDGAARIAVKGAKGCHLLPPSPLIRARRARALARIGSRSDCGPQSGDILHSSSNSSRNASAISGAAAMRRALASLVPLFSPVRDSVQISVE